MDGGRSTARGVILGLNAWHGDASACLMVDGHVVAAIEEERLRRVKHWAGLPTLAIRACLAEASLGLADVEHVAVNRDPRAHRLEKVWHLVRRRPSPGHVLDRLRNARRLGGLAERLCDELGLERHRFRARLHAVEHHRAHLASACFASPWERCSVASVDGFGDFSSALWGHARGSRVDVHGRVGFPHSLGLFYLALTQYLGFPRYGDEYKLMGLAAYGEPRMQRELEALVGLDHGGGFRLDLRFFRHHRGEVAMTWQGGEPVLANAFSPLLEELLGAAREPGSELTQRHRDLAASVQAVYEGALFHLLRALHDRTGEGRLALAGGCAMNSLANGRIEGGTPFEEVYVPPAPGDAGGALGAALWVWRRVLRGEPVAPIEHAYLGPALSSSDTDRALRARRDELDAAGVGPGRTLPEAELCERVARHLEAGHVVGWVQGRMELGPRALGARSILGDPRRADMQDVLNRRIKRRESFRPFAPAVLAERQGAWFASAAAVPFMSRVFPVLEAQRGRIPAVVHADGTGRLQTVQAATNPRFHRLIRCFEQRTGVPILLNTSFNENEPIVHRPEEAVDCFLRTRMDVLVLGDRILERVALPLEEPDDVAAALPAARRAGIRQSG